MKKGFTILELLVSLVIIALIGGIGILSYNYIFGVASDNYYKTIENSLKLSGNEYFTHNREELPIKGYSVVSLDDLVNGNYISPVKDKKGENCERGDVYVTRNSDTNTYDYEVCLNCLGYESEGVYCSGGVPGSINVKAVKEGTDERYNPLLSYKNVDVTDKNVVVTLTLANDNLSYFKVDKVNNHCELVNKSCEVTITNSGSYQVSAYNDKDEKIADDIIMSFKIDREPPTFTIKNDKRYLINGTDINKSIPIKIENVKDDIGIKDIKYCISNKNDADCSVSSIVTNNIINETKESGKYEIKVIATDLADHKAEHKSEFDVSYYAKLQYPDNSLSNFEVIYKETYGY